MKIIGKLWNMRGPLKMAAPVSESPEIRYDLEILDDDTSSELHCENILIGLEVSKANQLPRKKIRILHIEDNEFDSKRLEADLLAHHPLESLGLIHASTLTEALDVLDDTVSINLIVTDLSLPDSQENETVKALKTYYPGVPLLVWTASEETSTVVESFRAGAREYFLKGRNNRETLIQTIATYAA